MSGGSSDTNSSVDSIQTAYSQLVARWRAMDDGVRRIYLEETFPLIFSYNSGKIENDEVTYHDTKEIFEHGRIVGFTGDPRTIFEIVNLKRAWQEAQAHTSPQTAFECKDLLHLHSVLTAGTYDQKRWLAGERPGTFKRGYYTVAHDVGYAPEEVEQTVLELLDEINSEIAQVSEKDLRSPLIISCYAHAKLVEIHPFADGNGRIARLFQNICLLKCNFPPFVVHEQNKLAYYGALDAFHEEGTLDDFVNFCMVESIVGLAQRQ